MKPRPRPSCLTALPDTVWDRLVEALDRPGLDPGTRVMVAMSGGVDSSVAAALMSSLGFDVVGVSMQLFDKHPQVQAEGTCCTLDDFQDARRVADQLGFPFYVQDFRQAFRREVIGDFIDSYARGETPSPCIQCNQHLKFDELITAAETIGAPFVVTGHYAQVRPVPGSSRLALHKGSDPLKDQSYFLFAAQQAQLARTLMPLGGLRKPEVRELGRLLGLHLAEKAESQEICFVEGGRYDRFLEGQGLQATPGPFRRVEDGRVLGEHQGYWRFTVGQRRGLGIASGAPLYVVRIDPATHTVWVGGASDLLGARLVVRDPVWVDRAPEFPIDCLAKIRSRTPEASAEVVQPTPGSLEVIFRVPQRAIAPGQAVVFYRGDEVLGGGWIAESR